MYRRFGRLRKRPSPSSPVSGEQYASDRRGIIRLGVVSPFTPRRSSSSTGRHPVAPATAPPLRVYQVTLFGKVGVITGAGPGTSSSTAGPATSGPALDAEFSCPTGLAFDRKESYVRHRPPRRRPSAASTEPAFVATVAGRGALCPGRGRRSVGKRAATAAPATLAISTASGSPSMRTAVPDRRPRAPTPFAWSTQASIIFDHHGQHRHTQLLQQQSALPVSAQLDPVLVWDPDAGRQLHDHRLRRRRPRRVSAGGDRLDHHRQQQVRETARQRRARQPRASFQEVQRRHRRPEPTSTSTRTRTTACT